jgi:outer membrane protein OmpA-like peptidoglycan-associated protein
MRAIFVIGFYSVIQTLSAQPLTRQSLQLVNTPKDELNPVVSPDGRSLYITVAGHPSNSGGIKDPGDIWVSVLTETGQWSAPVHAGPVLNDKGYNAVAGFSADGSQLFLVNHYDPSGNVSRTQGIAVSRNNGNGWSRPENITIPYFQNKSDILAGFISPDLSVFVYSAETYGTRGVEDLYVTLRGADGKWSEPRNLGSTINTQLQELSPSLSTDGKTLYFASNGRKGYGSFDIYSSSRLDDTWTAWTTPVNLGSPFNTEGREEYFRNYDKSGFSIYTSTHNSDGYANIELFISNDPIHRDSAVVASVRNTPDTVTKIVALNRSFNEDQRIRIHGKVTSSKTGEDLQASVLFSSPEQTETVQATVGNGYAILIPSTREYSITIEAPGYISTMEKLNVNTYEMKELEMNFKLQPVAMGVTVNLKDILFEQGTTNLLAQSYPEMDLVVSFLKTNPKVKIELAGHTDNRGIPAQNVKLSQARVDKVRAYLISKGVESKRITGKGYGGSKPIASNDTEETRQFNRRVEFIIRKF